MIKVVAQQHTIRQQNPNSTLQLRKEKSKCTAHGYFLLEPESILVNRKSQVSAYYVLLATDRNKLSTANVYPVSLRWIVADEHGTMTHAQHTLHVATLCVSASDQIRPCPDHLQRRKSFYCVILTDPSFSCWRLSFGLWRWIGLGFSVNDLKFCLLKKCAWKILSTASGVEWKESFPNIKSIFLPFFPKMADKIGLEIAIYWDGKLTDWFKKAFSVQE